MWVLKSSLPRVAGRRAVSSVRDDIPFPEIVFMSWVGWGEECLTWQKYKIIKILKCGRQKCQLSSYCGRAGVGGRRLCFIVACFENGTGSCCPKVLPAWGDLRGHISALETCPAGPWTWRRCACLRGAHACGMASVHLVSWQLLFSAPCLWVVLCTSFLWDMLLFKLRPSSLLISDIKSVGCVLFCYFWWSLVPVGRGLDLLLTLAPSVVTVTEPSTQKCVPLWRLAVTCVPLERTAPFPFSSFYFVSHGLAEGFSHGTSGMVESLLLCRLIASVRSSTWWGWSCLCVLGSSRSMWRNWGDVCGLCHTEVFHWKNDSLLPNKAKWGIMFLLECSKCNFKWLMTLNFFLWMEIFCWF